LSSRLTFHVVGDSPLSDTMRLALAEVRHEPTTLEAADLLVLALDGEQLVDRIETYAQANLFKPGQLVMHTSSNFGYGVLSPATKVGAIPLALHPALQVTGTSLDLPRLQECHIAVSAPKIVMPIVQALALELGGEPVIIEEEARAAYAEGFSVAMDFSAMVVKQAIGLMEAAGIAEARDLVGPVVRSSIDRALADGHSEPLPEDFGGGI